MNLGIQRAILKWEGNYFLSEHASRPFDPNSALTKLIEWIYSNHATTALWMLREPIFIDYPSTTMCRGMTRVAARKLSSISIEEMSEQIKKNKYTVINGINEEPISIQPDQLKTDTTAFTHTDWMTFVSSILKTQPTPEQKPRFQQNRRVAAALVSSENVVLAATINSNAKIKTMHAEVNLLREYFYRNENALPLGAKIYSTLKPCRMCASMIWHCSEDMSKMHVYFSEFDEGANARQTILDANSFDRRQVAKNRMDLESQYETQILMPFTA